MRLTAIEVQVFEDWIRRKIEHPSCQVCQGNQWKIGDLLSFESDGVLDDFARPEPRMVQLVCRNCAHVLLFDVRTVEGWNLTPHDTSHSDIM